MNLTRPHTPVEQSHSCVVDYPTRNLPENFLGTQMILTVPAKERIVNSAGGASTTEREEPQMSTTLDEQTTRYWLVSQSETGIEVPLTPRHVADSLDAAGWKAEPLFAAREIETHLEEGDPERLHTTASVIESLGGSDLILEEARYLRDLASRIDRIWKTLEAEGSGC